MKFKLLSIFVICLFLFCCGAQKLSDQQVTEAIKAKFHLTEGDKIEILGIAEEAKNTSIVKLKLNGVDLTAKMMKYDTGWQIEEFKNELGLWISADVIAKMFDHSVKQKMAMLDISTISAVIVDWMTDNGRVPDMNGEYDENSKFYNYMTPFYIKILPIKDPWGNNFLIYCKEATNGKYGITGASNLDFIVVSLGKDGISESGQDFVSVSGSGLTSIRDYDIDLVMWNGSWIRSPKID